MFNNTKFITEFYFYSFWFIYFYTELLHKLNNN